MAAEEFYRVARGYNRPNQPRPDQDDYLARMGQSGEATRQAILANASQQAAPYLHRADVYANAPGQAVDKAVNAYGKYQDFQAADQRYKQTEEAAAREAELHPFKLETMKRQKERADLDSLEAQKQYDFEYGQTEEGGPSRKQANYDLGLRMKEAQIKSLENKPDLVKEARIIKSQEKADAAAIRAQDKEDRLNLRKEEHTNKEVERLGKEIDPLQGVGNTISNLEKNLGFKLEDYDKGKVAGKKVDLPGVSIPGMGRVSAYSSDARTLEATAAQIFNRELKERSGSAVADSEFARLKTEFAAGKYNTEEELIKALKDYKAATQLAMQNTQARFSPESKDEYKRRGGQTLDDFKSGSTPLSDIDSMSDDDVEKELAQRRGKVDIEMARGKK